MCRVVTRRPTEVPPWQIRHLAYLMAYCLIASSTLIASAQILHPLQLIKLSVGAVLVVACSLGAGLLSFALRTGRPAGLVVAIPALWVWVVSAVLLSLVGLLDGAIALRFLFLWFLFGGFIVCHNLLIFGEGEALVGIDRDLRHRRYLEYGRSFFWALAFTTIGYLAWELQSGFYTALARKLPEAVGFLQFAGIGAAGAVLVFLAFHTRLTLLERR